MDLVSGAFGSLLLKLGELLKDEYDLQTGLRRKIESLSQELESVNAVLHQIREVPPEQLEEPLRLWARDLREASYDMEDILDTFLVRIGDPQAAADPHTRWRFREKVRELFDKTKDRYRIAVGIEDINQILQDVASRHGRYTVHDIVPRPAIPATIDPRIQALYKNTSELVGIEWQMERLVNMLSLDDRRMKMVSIFGFGGLGKTTLAKVVYDKKFKLGFDCGAFIPVGQNPNMKKVLRDILIDLQDDKDNVARGRSSNFGLGPGPSHGVLGQIKNVVVKMLKYVWTFIPSWPSSPPLDMALLDERQLISQLHQFLQKKRCFIVIDDIWDKKPWDLIKCALQGNNCGSRVVATTRNFDVAMYVGDVYKMQPLSNDESKKLLYTRLGERGESLTSPLVEACDRILKKCGGVPLAIITMASLLCHKPKKHWCEVSNSIGLGHKDNVVQNTKTILSLSYYDLPWHLKPCLLYISLFPEDCYIEKNLLIWKWIAEGFVKEEEEAKIGLFETGEGYFNELINRSMIQPVEDENSGYVDGCRVHDMVLDLILLLSAEENFVTVVDGRKQHVLPSNNTRRLALRHGSFEENGCQLANVRAEKLRCLVMSECYDISRALPSFDVLRVLAIEKHNTWNDDSKISVQHVGKLLHLRYLGLQFNHSVSLLEEVKILKFLQVLDLLGSNIKQLPDSVSLLTKLLCLRVDSGTRVLPRVIEKLLSLQEMWIEPSIGDTWHFVKVLGKLRELRVLRIYFLHLYGEDETSALLESLRNLHKIQTMEIGKNMYGGEGITWDAGFGSPQLLRYLRLICLTFHRIPVWINSSLFPDLSYLHLQVNVLDRQGMEALGRLPKLRYLKVNTISTGIVIIEETAGSGYFRELRFFSTRNLCVLFDLHRIMCSKQKDVMPNLEVLEFLLYVRILKDDNLLRFDKLVSLAHLGRSSLQRVQVNIDCHCACPVEVEEAEAILVRVVEEHPNHPSLKTNRFRQEVEMFSTHQEVHAPTLDQRLLAPIIV